ncbi:MAG: MarR family winged helix-turn-helix transcriptional regulator [Sciscionella sp.]
MPQAEPDRRQACEAVERELSVLFGRARSVSLELAEQLHPQLDAGCYALALLLLDWGAIRAAEVAERTGVDKSTVSRQLSRLEDLGLVERVADPSDGRARLVALRGQGRERLNTLRVDRRQRLYELFGSWRTVDLREFARLLTQFNEAL